MKLSYLKSKLMLNLIIAKADLRKAKHRRFVFFRKRKITQLESVVNDLQEQVTCLSGVEDILKESAVKITTDDVHNDLEEDMFKMGFYLIKRDFVNNKFEHSYLMGDHSKQVVFNGSLNRYELS